MNKRITPSRRSKKVDIPEVTIIIPAYNAGDTIERCIKSVLSQSFTNIEVIVIDDGSIDDTVKKVKKYKEQRLRLIEQTHLGVSVARNNGIKHSNGRFLMFLDSDDSLELNAVEVLLETAKSISCNSIVFSFFEVNGNNRKKRSLEELSNRCFDFSKENDYEALIDNVYKKDPGMPCYCWTLLLDRRLTMNCKLQFHEDLGMMEDAVFFLDFLNSGSKVFFLDKCLCNHYNDNKQSVTHSSDNYLKVISGAIRSSMIIVKNIKNDPIIASKYFKIIFGYISRYIHENKKADELFFDNECLYLANIANMRNEKNYWKLAGKAITTKNRHLLYFLAMIYNVHDMIRRKK